MAEATPTHKTAYHKTQGAVFMPAVDAHHAVGRFPDEWSWKPWGNTPGANLPSDEPVPLVPSDWVDLQPSKMIALARELGAQGYVSGAKAEEFIQKYLDDRAKAPPVPATKPPAEAKQADKAEADRLAAAQAKQTFGASET